MKHLGLGLALASSLTSASVLAAEWYQPPAPTAWRPGLQQAATERAAVVLRDQATVFRLHGIELTPVRELRFADFRTVRFVQRYQGLPVWSTAVAARVAPDGSVRAVMVDVARDLTVSVVPKLDEQAARAVAEATMGQSLPAGSSAELGVLPHDDLGGVLAWRVHVPTEAGMMRYEVDAHRGTLIQAYSLARDAKGLVYPIDPSTPAEERELPNLTPLSPQKLTGRAGAVYRHVSGDLETGGQVICEQSTEPNSGEDFLYPPPSDPRDLADPFADVNLYYHMDRMDSYFRDTFGLPMDYGLLVVSNYAPGGKPYPNAFYTPWGGYGAPNAIFLGQANVDFSYDSDVMLHEFTHYVNQNAVNFSEGVFDFDQYGLVTMPGAINEGTADYFSSSVNDDPVVGSVALGTYARNLEGASGRCPEDLWGESHEDGKLIGTVSWAVRKAVGAQLGDQLVWGALTMLPSGPSLGDFAKGLLQGAEDLLSQGTIDAAQMQQIEQAIAARGLDDCGRGLSLAGKTRKTSLFGLQVLGQYMGGYSCSQMQQYGMQLSSLFYFQYTPKPQDTDVVFKVELERVHGSGDLNWSVFVRRVRPVTFASTGNSPVPVPTQYDIAKRNITESSVEIVINADTTPAFQNTFPYYMVIAHKNCPITMATVSAIHHSPQLEPDAGPDSDTQDDAATTDPDAGSEADAAQEEAGSGSGELTPEQDASDDGCSCRVASESSGGWSAAAALGALGLLLGLRRRK